VGAWLPHCYWDQHLQSKPWTVGEDPPLYQQKVKLSAADRPESNWVFFNKQLLPLRGLLLFIHCIMGLLSPLYTLVFIV